MSYEHNPDHPLATAFPYFPPDEQEWLQRELSQILNAQLAMGPRVAQFEKEFAAYAIDLADPLSSDNARRQGFLFFET